MRHRKDAGCICPRPIQTTSNHQFQNVGRRMTLGTEMPSGTTVRDTRLTRLLIRNDADTVSVQGGRRRRARRTNRSPESDVQQSNKRAPAGNEQIVDMLTQLVANQNKKNDCSSASWTSIQKPFKGVRWRGGTPPAPPAWKNSNDLRAFARWGRKIGVWTMQIKAFMPMSDAALMLFTSLTGEAEFLTERLDLSKINTNDGIKYLMDSLREPLQQKLPFQKRKLLSDYEQIARYPNKSACQFCNIYVRVEKDPAAIGVSTWYSNAKKDRTVIPGWYM